MKQCKSNNMIWKSILSYRVRARIKICITKVSICFLFLICIIAGEITIRYNQQIVQASNIEQKAIDSEDKLSDAAAADKNNRRRRIQSPEQTALYNYLNNKENCISVFNNAVKMNDGDVHDTCVFFLSEALRKVNINIPKSICFTGRYRGSMKNEQSVIKYLLDNGWKIDYNPKHLLPGDICFSIDKPGKDGGYPTHVYTFMGWSEEGSTDTAYIVDNQGYKFGGNNYHVRNITKKGPNDPFHFFMYKPVK
ncbi:MAG: hypothetical protein Q8936_04340 [Bacillota bacterium]|nr:hypothetical protein [Bacillota bacterium]